MTVPPPNRPELRPFTPKERQNDLASLLVGLPLHPLWLQFQEINDSAVTANQRKFCIRKFNSLCCPFVVIKVVRRAAVLKCCFPALFLSLYSDRPYMGCRPGKRAAVPVFLFCLGHVFLTTLVLNAFYIPYYQTGSFMPPDDYEWYNGENFAARRFPNDSPVNWSGVCSAKDKRALPSVEDMRQEIQELLGSTKEHQIDELCSLNSTQRIAVVHNPSSRRGLLALLWNFILPPEASPCPCSEEPTKEEEDENKQSSFRTCIHLQAYGISLHLLSWPVDEEDLSSYESVVVVGDLSPQVREILDAVMKKKDIRLGLITVDRKSVV